MYEHASLQPSQFISIVNSKVCVDSLLSVRY